MRQWLNLKEDVIFFSTNQGTHNTHREYLGTNTVYKQDCEKEGKEVVCLTTFKKNFHNQNLKTSAKKSVTLVFHMKKAIFLKMIMTIILA